MTEREARGLAAELDGHRWWRPIHVGPGGTDTPFWLSVKHRTHPNSVVVLRFCDSQCVPSDELAAVLTAWGEEDAAGGGSEQLFRVWPAFPDEDESQEEAS